MTHTVAPTSSAAATADTHPARSARAASTSFAEVQAAAVKSADSNKGTSSSSDAKDASTTAPKGEKTQAVDGHSYKEIVSGPRNGMFINNTGNRRDGEAFLIVKRHGREFHIYGAGDDRTVYEVGRKREDADNGATGPTTTDSSTTGTTTGASTTAAAGAGTTA